MARHVPRKLLHKKDRAAMALPFKNTFTVQ
jgi:hypothetical protein